jgi:DNA-binding beta-propeller fold protein YncE
MKFCLPLLGLCAIVSAQTLLVLNKEDATLAMVDPNSGKISARIPTGEGPHEVATDGKLAYVGNYGAQTPGSTLSIIDLASKRELHRVDLGPLRRPHGMFAADGKAYFTAELNKLIARYDPASNQVDWLLGTGQGTTHMVIVAAGGTKIFTANIGSDSISIFERGSNPMNWNQTVIPVGKGPEAIDVSPDGKQIWTAHSGDGGVSVIDIASKRVVRTLDVKTKRSNRLKLTADGKRVLITDLEAGDLLVLDAVSGSAIKRMKIGKSPEGILMDPNGARAFVAVNGNDHVAVFDLKTLEVTGKLSTGRGPDGMAWVP